jgi:hypothetical protein
MRVQEHVVERLVKVPAEAVGWASLRGEMACPDCLITTYQPEMGLQRARRIIHHILWQYPQNLAWSFDIYSVREIHQPNSSLALSCSMMGKYKDSYKSGPF